MNPLRSPRKDDPVNPDGMYTLILTPWAAQALSNDERNTIARRLVSLDQSLERGAGAAVGGGHGGMGRLPAARPCIR